MHVLLYVPDNLVTRNFIPHLWPFVLQQLTPKEHQVTIIDRNARRMTDEDLLDFIRTNNVDLVGMGFMTRMAQAAYHTASQIRANTSALVVMGGPHVTELPDEPLGKTGHPQCADAVVRGEADDLWALVLEDAKAKRLKPLYEPATLGGKDLKPSLKDYPVVPWDELDLSLFNLMRFVPSPMRTVLRRTGIEFGAIYVLPLESGRGCPYGCEFCTVTGFFGDSIRFRDNDSVIEELRRIKALEKRDDALIVVCFVDDNIAIDKKRLKSLLRDMIANDVCVPWWGQVSMNLLRDEELIHLMAASGARCVLIGLESLNAEGLQIANKSFNKPDEYATILDNLAKYDIAAVTSFIIGMDTDTPGVAHETARKIHTWAPGFPVYSSLTPYPATPLYDRLRREGRLTRPFHWLDFKPFKATFQPKQMSPEQMEEELRQAWQLSYNAGSFRHAHRWFVEHDKPFAQQMGHFIVRMFFRGIYLHQVTAWAWLKVVFQNADTVAKLIWSGVNPRKRAGEKRQSWHADHNPAFATETVPKSGGDK
jgi:radical SAM superfamily enzyme YgiQ (UPF0313 family)